jgi:membrane protease YdiL (CAAX protease family)
VAGSRRRWRKALLLALSGVLCALAGGVASLALGDSQLALAADGLGTSALLGFLAWAGAASGKEPAASRLGLGASRLPRRQQGALIVGIVALSHALATGVELWAPNQAPSLVLFEEILAGARGATLAALCLGLAFAPGILEELLFRGYVQRGLERRIGAPGAVLVAAALFGLVHGEPVHAAAAFVLGIYLGLAAVLAGSVRAAIACHVVNNLVAVLEGAWDTSLAGGGPPGLAAGLGVAVGAAAWVAWRRPTGSVALGHPVGEDVAHAQEQAQQAEPYQQG